MKKILCVFCKEKGEKYKEHIWPKWIQRKIVGNTNGTFSGRRVRNLILSEKPRIQSGESLVYGNICKKCNNGWMSQLEDSFILIYAKIEANNNYSLNKKERNILSLWAFKTCLLINISSDFDKIVPNDHFSHLYEHKQLPKDIFVEMSKIIGNPTLKWEQSIIRTSIISKFDSPKNHIIYTRNNSYVICLQIGNVAIKVVFLRDCKANGYTIELNDQINLQRVHPYLKNPKSINKKYFATMESMADSTFLCPK